MEGAALPTSHRGARTAAVFACVAAASLLVTVPARATCMQLGCEVTLLRHGCVPHPVGQSWPSTQPPRLSIECRSGCSPPGGPMSVRVEPFEELHARQLKLWRRGCRAPAEGAFVLQTERCDGRAVVVFDRPLSPGVYQLAVTRSTLEIRVVGPPRPPPAEERVETDGAPEDDLGGACPSVAAYQERLRKEEAERLERQREAHRLALEQQRARDDELRRSCPGRWDVAGRYCRPVPPPSSSTSPPSRRPKPPPAAPSPWDRFWEDGEWNEHRADWGWELGVGVPVALLVRGSEDDRERRWMIGGQVSIGFRRHHDFQAEGLVGEYPGLSWCAPFACGIAGMIAMPVSSFAGNEFGLDLRARLWRDAWPDAPVVAGGLSLRPTARVARDSRARTGTFFGALLPEVGLTFSHDRPVEFRLSAAPYPIDVRLGRYLAFTWDGPVVGPAVPFDGGRVWVHVSTSASLTWLQIGD